MISRLFAAVRPKSLQERRQFARVPVREGKITIEGKQYTLIDWTVKGFLISGYDGKLEKGQRFTLEVAVPERDDLIAFEASAQVVRRGTGRGNLGAVFTDLSTEAKRRIAEYSGRRAAAFA